MNLVPRTHVEKSGVVANLEIPMSGRWGQADSWHSLVILPSLCDELKVSEWPFQKKKKKNGG